MKKILLSLTNGRYLKTAVDYTLVQAEKRRAELILSYFVEKNRLEKVAENFKNNYFLGRVPAEDLAVKILEIELARAAQQTGEILTQAKKCLIRCRKVFIKGTDYIEQSYRLASEHGVDLLILCGKRRFWTVNASEFR